MHVALVVDEERLLHEHPTLNRISIGLIGEGVKLTRIVPQQLSPTSSGVGEQRVALASRIEIPMKVVPWMRRDRTEQIADAMEKGPPDVIYALGEQAWPVALDIARRMDRPLALDVWSAEQVRRMPLRRRSSKVAAYIVPTHAIAEALRQRVDPGLVCHVPAGVALPAEPRAVLGDPERAIALAIVGRGRDVAAYRALLSGLRRVVNEMSQIHAFLELAGPAEHEIWRHARQLELLENVSAITDAARLRALLTRCDMLLLPERFGELRTLILESMAFGLPVVMAYDPYLDMLEPRVSAAVVDEASAEQWSRHLRRLLTDPEAARKLGLAGRERIARDHRSSAHVERLIDTLNRVASGGAYLFERQSG
jgi:hypothetical protein